MNYEDDPDKLIVAALNHSKYRDMFGLVVVSAYPKYKKITVNFAREWKRDDMDDIHGAIKKYHVLQNWDKLVVEQLTGQHIISKIKSSCDLTVHTINTQKDMKDPEGIEDVIIMDITEMVQLFLKLKLKHQILFPKNSPKTIKVLELQTSIFMEHSTEAGSMSYFGPGDENDHLIKSLLDCCFAVRKEIELGEVERLVIGPLDRKEDKFNDLSPILDMDNLSKKFVW